MVPVMSCVLFIVSTGSLGQAVHTDSQYYMCCVSGWHMNVDSCSISINCTVLWSHLNSHIYRSDDETFILMLTDH
jgi:hypothetical protein